MSGAASSGRKKPRTKETKPPLARTRSGSTTLVHPPASAVAVDDAGAHSALTDAPYVCTGRFGVDFVQLCRRAHLAYIPYVVARPHWPGRARVSVGDEVKKSIIPGPPKSSKMRSSVIWDQSALARESADGFIPEPPPKTYVLRDPISFFRPSVQVSPFIC